MAIIRAVLFDVYGTLIKYPQTSRVEQLALQTSYCGLRFTVAEVGRAFNLVTNEANQRKIYDGDFRREAEGHTKVFYRWYYKRLLELLGASGHLESLAQRMFEEYVLIPGWQLDPQALPLLRTLKSSAFSLGVVSNGPRQVRDVLAMYRLDRFMQTIVISDVFESEKPHPAIFRRALSDLGVAANECVYVGDVPEADMVGARRAGMRGILIDPDNKYRSLEIPCTHIRELNELAGILGL